MHPITQPPKAAGRADTRPAPSGDWSTGVGVGSASDYPCCFNEASGLINIPQQSSPGTDVTSMGDGALKAVCYLRCRIQGRGRMRGASPSLGPTLLRHLRPPPPPARHMSGYALGTPVSSPLEMVPWAKQFGQNNEVSAARCSPQGVPGHGAQFAPNLATNSRVSTQLGHA